MNISLSQANGATGSTSDAQDGAHFDRAIRGAQEDLSEQELLTMLVEGAVKAAGPMLIMPKANDILNEAMSDD